MDCWVFELHNGFKAGYKISDILYNEKSKYQRIFIAETESHGKILLLDNIVMLTERMEFIYHEIISHIPLFVHPNPEKVLIIGGGDGGTLREALKHSTIKKIDLVEIDEKVIEASKKYLKSLSIDFENPKANIIITDGIEFVKNKTAQYDVIIIDSSDPIGPAEGLFTEEFYKNCFNILTSDGILMAQAESPFYMEEYFKKFFKILEKLFPITKPALACVPDYPYALWGFIFASKKYNPITDFDPERYKNSGIFTKYYNEKIHISSFTLPNFVREMLK